MKWFRRLQAMIDFPVSKSVGRIKVHFLWLRDFSYLVSADVPEPRMSRCFEAVITGWKPTLFLDIGANIGVYSWQVLNMTDETGVWLFEPDEKNAALLSRTIAASELKRATLHPVALSDQRGDFPFLIDEISGTTGSLENQAYAEVSLHHAYAMSETRNVRCVELDSLLEGIQGHRVVMKIDVEGGEHKVLRGARRVLREVRPVIFLECFELEKLDWLEELEYRIYDLREARNYLVYPAEMQARVEAEWANGLS